ncbi:MAG TPA: hypothetical protein VKF63_12210 [Terracidiphilus sp.]|nr:hypothetical protein [Terracidiphilus sp.]
MNWPYLIQQIRVVFLLGFTLFAVWLVVKWVRHARVTSFTIRDWIGAFAFWLGILSSFVLGYSYAYFWATHMFLAGARGLLYLLEFGFVTAVAGTLLGVAGRGWVRRAAVFVSVVAAFQWANFAFPPTGVYLVTEAMFASLAAGMLLWVGIHKIRTARKTEES